MPLPGIGRSDPSSIDGVVYKIADTVAERNAAFELLYESYTMAQMMAPNGYRMRVTPWHLAPSTDLFIASAEGEVIYTMTLVGDDEERLPLEAVYPGVVRQLRRQQIRLGEVTCLAARHIGWDSVRMFDVFTQLVGLMFQCACVRRIERLLIAVHPRHARFYCRSLGFRQVGDVRAYDSVGGKPAVACEHDFQRENASGYPLYDRVFGCVFQPSELRRRPLSGEERESYEPVVAVCSEFATSHAA